MPTHNQYFEVKCINKPSTIVLKDAIQYALSVEGSGFRDQLSRASSVAAGLDKAETETIAQGLEYFHHASLLLDDLPCMDDASERRGQPSTHVVYGESRTLLTALALINRGYISCWTVASRHPERSAAAARLVSRAIGENGILDGQDRDLHFCGGGAAEVRKIARLKTGTLLELVMLLPAVLRGAPVLELLALARLARAWGQLYQGIDDFKDLLLSESSSGKTPYRDLANNRPNIVVALGARHAAEELFKVLEVAERQISILEGKNSAWGRLESFQEEFRCRLHELGQAVEAA